MPEILRDTQCDVNAQNAMASFCAIGNTADMDAAEWIRRGLTRSGKTQRGLAEALGIDPAGVNRMLKGLRQLRADEIPKVARYFGDTSPPASLALSTSLDPSPGSGLIELSGQEVAVIPRFDAAISAGHGSFVDPNAEPLGHQFIEHQWLRAITQASPSELAVVRVAGDSMERTLADGDWILVDRTQRRLNREGVYALAVGDACWVKRLTLNFREQTIRVLSDNPAYPMQELTEEDLTVIGRVIWIVGRKV